MNWNERFAQLPTSAPSDMGAEPSGISTPPILKLFTNRLSGVRKWGIAEWGSLASIIGVGLWLYDQFTPGGMRGPHSKSRP